MADARPTEPQAQAAQENPPRISPLAAMLIQSVVGEFMQRVAAKQGSPLSRKDAEEAAAEMDEMNEEMLGTLQDLVDPVNAIAAELAMLGAAVDTWAQRRRDRNLTTFLEDYGEVRARAEEEAPDDEDEDEEPPPRG